MTHVLLFAKAPVAGLCKTRLIPALGSAGAAELARRLLLQTLTSACAAFPGQVTLCAEPAPADPRWQGCPLPAGLMLQAQGDGDLGARLHRACAEALTRHDRVLLIGMDCPALTPTALRAAAARLDLHDAVLQPAHDGGYVLLGLRRCHASLFENMPWSTPQVLALTQQRLQALGWSTALQRPLHDIDEPADLVHLPPTFLEALS